jgi:hypothetical protein
MLAYYIANDVSCVMYQDLRRVAYARRYRAVP